MSQAVGADEDRTPHGPLDPTDEMVQTYLETPGTGPWARGSPEDGCRAGLAAVLPIVAAGRCLAPAGHAHAEPSVDLALAEARGRRQAYETIRRELATELRGAPYNAPARTQITYVGGLARARRIVERLFRDALAAEEHLLLDEATPGQV